MKVADLPTANSIVKRLGEISTERAALEKTISVAGVRTGHSGGPWVNAGDAEGRAACGRAIGASLDREEAALRRRAAQISLALETKA